MEDDGGSLIARGSLARKLVERRERERGETIRRNERERVILDDKY